MNILCIATLSNIWDLHGKHEMALLAALRERGAVVDYVVCDGLGGICEAYPSNFPPVPFYECLICWRRGSRRARALGFKPKLLQGMRRFRDARKARAWATSLAPEDFSTARYGAYELGRWVHSSILTMFRLSRYAPGMPHVDTAYRRYLENVLREAWAVERHLDARAYERVVLFNGRVAYTKVVLELARMRDIPVYVHERGRFEHISLALNEICGSIYLHRRLWDEWRNIPLMRAELEEVSRYLYQRERGDIATINWSPYSTPPGNAGRLRHDLGIEPTKRIWALFTSSTDEVAANPEFEAKGFDSQHHWLEHAITAAARHPDVHLVVRAHPNLCGYPIGRPALGELEFFHALKRRVGGNVTIVEPHELLSTYDLMNIADVGITYVSSCGLEMAAKGKPVCISCTAFYDGINEIDKAFSPELMDALFDAYAALPRGHIDLNLLRMVLRFWYAHVFRTSFPFPFVSMPSFIGEGEYTFTSTRELAQGKNAVLDHLCLAIEKGEQPLWRPGTEHHSRSTQDEDEFLAERGAASLGHKDNEAASALVAKTPSPMVSIIIRSARGGHNLEETVDTLKKQTYPQGRYEILIVPDAEKWTCPEVLKKVRGELLFVCDEALRADADLMKVLAGLIVSDERIGIAAGKVLPAKDNNPEQWIGAFSSVLRRLSDLGELTLISKSNYFPISRYRLFRRNILESIALAAPGKIWVEVYENTAQSDACALEAGYSLAYTADASAFLDENSLRRSPGEIWPGLIRASWQHAYVTFKKIPPRWKRHSVTVADSFVKILFFLLAALRSKIRGNADGYRVNLGKAACELGFFGGAMVTLPRKIWRLINGRP